MPFNKTAPKTLFSFNSTKSSPEDIEDLEEKKKQRGEIMSKASYKARDNLTWELLQSFLGSKRSKTPEALEQQLLMILRSKNMVHNFIPGFSLTMKMET